MSLTPRTLSVVIPMRNEAENVSTLLTEIQEALQPLSNYEIIVVDDGSTDETYANLMAAQKKLSHLKIIQFKQNFGQTVAMIKGVQSASMDFVATLDGDGQNDPHDIPKMLEVLIAELNHDEGKIPVLVNGIRAKRHDSILRKLSSRVANKIRKTLLKDDCPDSACGLKVFKREDFLCLPHFNHIHRFLPALFKRANGKIVNIPVNHRARSRGVSKYSIRNRLWVGIVDLVGVMWLIRRACNSEVTK